MLQNYIKIAIRNLWRYKGYSSINILGLAVGMACCILILLFVVDELGYDTMHENGDRTYRITREWKNSDGSTSLHLARVAPPVGELLHEEFPDAIEAMVRIRSDYQTVIRVSDRTFVEERFRWAETAFFEIFSFRLLHGDPASALKESRSVVLSASTAERYFGSPQAAMGQSINYDGEFDLVVSGVVEDAPSNSHFKYDILASFQTIYDEFGTEFMRTNWGRNNYGTYLLLAENVTPEAMSAKFPDFLDHHLTQAARARTGEDPAVPPRERNVLHLQALTDIHLHSHLNSEWEANGDINNIYIFTVIAMFILLIASINFMNLSTARSSKRAREIGMRKVMGAQRTQLVFQFIGESIFITLIAFIVAVVIVELALPSFNDFAAKDLDLSITDNYLMLLAMGGLLLFVGLLSGSYPAFYLSGFRPLAVLKDTMKSSTGKSNFRAALVVLQFSISIALVICVGVVYSQLDFWHDKKLGYDKENIVLLPGGQTIMERLPAVKARMMAHPGVVSVAGSRLVPTNNLVNSWSGRTLDGDKPVPIQFRLAVHEVDHDFISTYDMKLLAGRDFSREFATDDTAAFILNEAAVSKLGWGTPQDAVDNPLIYGGRRGNVIGVLEDFHFESLHNEIVPIIFLITERNLWTISARIRGENVAETIQYLEGMWTELRPDFPFEYEFLDQQYASLYNSEELLMKIFSVFSLLAIFVACLGLLGLASFTAEQKTKEIGIRKVLGASVSKLLMLLTKEYLRWILVASLIAWPLAWWGMQSWLEDFAYPVDLNPGLFILAAGIALLIAILTVSWQALKAAVANPVEALKYE